MDMTNESCRKFVEVLASNAPTPGGGGAAALVGAVGTALGNMVGSLTVGKKKYADVEEEIFALKAKCDALQTELLNQVAADAVGFEPLPMPMASPRMTPTGGRSWRRQPSPPALFPCGLWSCAVRPWTPLQSLLPRAAAWQFPTPVAALCA